MFTISSTGWIELDVTSVISAGESHISSCATLYPLSAVTIPDVTHCTGVDCDLSNTVTRIFEDSRVIQIILSEEQWAVNASVEGARRFPARDLERSVHDGQRADFLSAKDTSATIRVSLSTLPRSVI